VEQSSEIWTSGQKEAEMTESADENRKAVGALQEPLRLLSPNNWGKDHDKRKAHVPVAGIYRYSVLGFSCAKC